MHRGRGKKEHDATTRDRQGTRPPVKASRWGGSGRADGGGNQREEGNPGQDNPEVDMDLIAQVEDGKGGETRQGNVDTGSHKELLGLPNRGGKCRQVVEDGRRGRCPGGRSLCAREIWGGRNGCKERDKWR